MSLRRGHRNQAGVVLPMRLMVFSISLVALAGLVFIATQDDDGPAKATPSSVTSPRTTAKPDTGQTQGTQDPAQDPGTSGTTVAPPTTPPPVNRRRTNVVVFNNTNTKGLAGETATQVTKAGWNVVTTDNWHGSVDASTVYFGPSMKAAAQLLAADLGIKRVKPSFAPMNPKQLTVILTADYR